MDCTCCIIDPHCSAVAREGAKRGLVENLWKTLGENDKARQGRKLTRGLAGDGAQKAAKTVKFAQLDGRGSGELSCPMPNAGRRLISPSSTVESGSVLPRLMKPTRTLPKERTVTALTTGTSQPRRALASQPISQWFGLSPTVSPWVKPERPDAFHWPSANQTDRLTMTQPGSIVLAVLSLWGNATLACLVGCQSADLARLPRSMADVDESLWKIHDPASPPRVPRFLESFTA